jgi:thiol-disulfide isomerase/thioredoxin
MSSLLELLPRVGRCARGLIGWFAAGLALAVGVRAEVKVGNAFPDLAQAGLVNLAGGPLPVTKGKVLLVDFWASWCAPCKASFPALGRIHRELGPQGLVIVAVGIDEKPSAAVAFWKRLNPPFATVHDATQKLVPVVAPPTMPTSYLVGRDGRVRAVHQGFHGETTEQELKRQLAALLAETP